MLIFIYADQNCMFSFDNNHAYKLNGDVYMIKEVKINTPWSKKNNMLYYVGVKG